VPRKPAEIVIAQGLLIGFTIVFLKSGKAFSVVLYADNDPALVLRPVVKFVDTGADLGGGPPPSLGIDVTDPISEFPLLVGSRFGALTPNHGCDIAPMNIKKTL
jgi:hypothetical protein